MIPILLSLVIILTYVGIMIKRNGIPYSISDTYYNLEHKVWFGFTMITTALFLIPTILDRTTEAYQFLAFLMCAGLCFVGVAPNFKDGLDRPIHIVATIIAATCSQIWVILMQPYMMLIWLLWILYIPIKLKQVYNGDVWNSFVKCKPLFWVEVIAFMTIYLTLLF